MIGVWGAGENGGGIGDENAKKRGETKRNGNAKKRNAKKRNDNANAREAEIRVAEKDGDAKAWRC